MVLPCHGGFVLVTMKLHLNHSGIISEKVQWGGKETWREEINENKNLNYSKLKTTRGCLKQEKIIHILTNLL